MKIPWRRSRRSVPAPEEPSVVSTVRSAVEAMARGGSEQAGHLPALLAALAATEDAGPGRAALGVLSEWPRVVVRLDEYARRAWWHELRFIGATRAAPDVPDSAVEAPVAVALASTYGDGRVRERAVAAMLAAPLVELMPFLVLRTSDWARPVRDRARAGLALLLADDPEMYLPAMLSATTAIEQRWRGTFAVAQATAALSTVSPGMRRTLATLPNPASRRFVRDLGLSWGWWSTDELIKMAESDPDVRIRIRAAEAACRDAVWRRRQAVLHRLAGCRSPEVRAVALTGLVRSGSDAEVVAHLDDPAPLARALAREAARRTGVDAFARYRDGVPTAPTPPVIAGFAEIASKNDAPLLDSLLSHPQAGVRAAAVRGLRQLDAVEAGRMVPLLRDPSAAVVREAVAALRPIGRAVPTELLWDLLADIRPELRRAGYRLLATGPLPTRLRAGLGAAADPDQRLAMHAQADVTGLARDATASAWHSGPTLDLAITAAEYTVLTDLLRRAAPVLAPDTVTRLRTWLTATTAA